MSIRIDHETAKEILIAEHNLFLNGASDPISIHWSERIAQLSTLCPPRKSATFIAAIGTALLAKSVNPNVDVYCLLDRDGNNNSYSARSLVDGVWAKNRAYLGIDIGANGPNPLNNTPFIGKARIDEIKNVRNTAGFNFLIDCLNLLAQYTNTEQARSALRGFIGIRKRNFSSTFSPGRNTADHLVLPVLIDAIHRLLAGDSEDGRCAQAVAAGLLAAAFDKENIEVGHVNDPDRNFPLDIAISQHFPEGSKISFAVEVKDKPIGGAEILHSVEKALNLNVNRIIYLAISHRQSDFLFTNEYISARNMGAALVVYTDWESFVKSCLGFSTRPTPELFSGAYMHIGNYLADLQVSQRVIDLWESFASPETTDSWQLSY